MLRAPTIRLPAALLTLGLFLASGVGIPVHHHVHHHDGDRPHVSSGDHAHGTTLVIRDVRTERPAASLDLPAAPTRAAIPAIRPAFAPDRRRTPTMPRGRSPPPRPLPRGPPSAS